MYIRTTSFDSCIEPRGTPHFRIAFGEYSVQWHSHELRYWAPWQNFHGSGAPGDPRLGPCPLE